MQAIRHVVIRARVTSMMNIQGFIILLSSNLCKHSERRVAPESTDDDNGYANGTHIGLETKMQAPRPAARLPSHGPPGRTCTRATHVNKWGAVYIQFSLPGQRGRFYGSVAPRGACPSRLSAPLALPGHPGPRRHRWARERPSCPPQTGGSRRKWRRSGRRSMPNFARSGRRGSRSPPTSAASHCRSSLRMVHVLMVLLTGSARPACAPVRAGAAASNLFAHHVLEMDSLLILYTFHGLL